MEYHFIDYYGNKVNLSFDDHPYSDEPKHVWVIARYQDKWLLTKHLYRGIEFPGGKVEVGESAKEAAIREVKEETGGNVSFLQYIGQYQVTGKEKVIVKNIYYAVIDILEKQAHYFETVGPILLDMIPLNIKRDKQFSFMMRDDVLSYSMRQINNQFKV